MFRSTTARAPTRGTTVAAPVAAVTTVVPGVGRTRAEVAEVRHQLSLEGVLEGRPVGRAGRGRGRRRRRGRRARARRRRARRPRVTVAIPRTRPGAVPLRGGRTATLGGRRQRQGHLALR